MKCAQDGTIRSRVAISPRRTDGEPKDGDLQTDLPRRYNVLTFLMAIVSGPLPSGEKVAREGARALTGITIRAWHPS
jgi:hypothetical protein